ncbi:hypothetical protein [Ligilactobacillus equi]|uniref:Uncharacterized protein n=1 Tax=Ligilactobacillus equi DSM 15833 = JCM 10991 TaxID=1423740 RepID=A0A0R1TK76_9LACO|nr:hypothetical protein [Ligilactobacillus equi]KRL81772.1 hypothetical protein FC36_GL001364 [Ligilactobacillus equi DSM 15833 = JCM 10991]
MEYENVREALKALIEITFSELETAQVKVINDKESTVRPFELEDLQDANKEILAQICDMLGMSDLYLESQEVS